MERQARPIKGAWMLALAAAAALTLRGKIDLMTVWGQAARIAGSAAPADVFQTALALGMIPGAFIAALPGRIRRRNEPRLRSTWQGCLSCFVSGTVLVIASGLAHGGDARQFTGLMQGSVSAYAFAGAAFLSGMISACLHGRRRRA